MNDTTITQIDNLLIYQKGYTPSFIKDTIDEHGLDGLQIFTDAVKEKPQDLDFLKECTFLDHLSIATGVDYDFGFLKRLPQLRKLSLNAWGKKEIDLSRQTNLECLNIQWRKNIIGLEKCINLKRIGLIDWKEKNLRHVGDLRNLQELIVKTASINTLDHIHDLHKLEHILLGNCRYLTYVKGINGLPNLKHIEFWSCTKISDYESLTNLPSLEQLGMTDCKKIASIKFIKNFPRLKRLVMTGNTDVEDGDLLPAKNIEKVICAHRRHYNIRVANNGSFVN